MSSGQIPAVDAGSALLVADVRMSVAVARATTGEAPEARLALVALASVDAFLATLALAGASVAEVVQRSDGVAFARGAALGAEAVRARRAPVAATSHHVLLALALAAQPRADAAFRARRVTGALCKKKPNIERMQPLVL